MKKHLQNQNRLWDYEILRQLGRGEYGTVFEVKSKKNGKIYALKKINIVGTQQKQKIQAFRQIKALKLIHHCNIIEFYESFLSMDHIYIVTEFADKGDLSMEIKKRLKQQKKYTEQQMWKIIEELTLGLKHLHEKKIIHRDIKAENIFHTTNDQYKIGDLGMSKIVYENKQSLSTRVGTPIYFAPQMIQHRMYSFPVDIWALGCVFYYMAALEHPFSQASMQTLGYYIVDKEPKPIKGAYSPQLISFILSLLDKNPQTRPTIHDIYKKLRARREAKFNNKVSIFNLKQILSMKAEHLEVLCSPSKKSSKNNTFINEGQQPLSPTIISQKKNKQFSITNSNPQNMQIGRRNYSLLLTKKRTNHNDRNKFYEQQCSSPMIKSTGFNMSPDVSPVKKQKYKTSRYWHKNSSFSSERSSPSKNSCLSKQIDLFGSKTKGMFM